MRSAMDDPQQWPPLDPPLELTFADPRSLPVGAIEAFPARRPELIGLNRER